ncbi:microsomal signal peptidase [Panus rudis PR-1116 ss-1]|nr:microsomal signal peptidase [Panus rudis PR-1116 ss-1]
MAIDLQKLTEGRIDFEGQKKVERISRSTLVTATVLSFLIGFILQSLRVTFAIFGISAIALLIVVVPPWPAYNRHPIQWLTPKVKEV